MSTLRLVAFGCLLGLAISLHWLPWLTESLWLDETVSYWIVSASFGEALSRASEFQHSTLYFALMWAVVHATPGVELAGMPEWAFRLPSLVCVGLASALVLRIGAALFDREAGWIAATVFALASAVASGASDARPYGLGLLLVTAALCLTLRWLGERGRVRDGAGAVALGCAALYTQPLLGLVLGVQAAAALASWMTGGRIPGAWLGFGRQLALRELALAGGIVALALAAYAPTVGALLADAGALSWAPEPPPWMGLQILVVPLALFAAIRWAPRIQRADLVPDWPALHVGLPLLLAWSVLPPLVLYAVSVTTPSHILLPHYASSAAPATALLLAGFIRSLPGPALRLAITAALLGGSLLTTTPRELEFADWRAGAADLRTLAITDTTPVLFHSGLIEASQIAWLTDARRSAYLLAPSLPYLVDREKISGRLVPLPYDLSTRAQAAYLARLVDRDLAKMERFVVTGRFPALFRDAIARRARSFSVRSAGSALVFERHPGPDGR